MWWIKLLLFMSPEYKRSLPLSRRHFWSSSIILRFSLFPPPPSDNSSSTKRNLGLFCNQGILSLGIDYFLIVSLFTAYEWSHLVFVFFSGPISISMTLSSAIQVIAKRQDSIFSYICAVFLCVYISWLYSLFYHWTQVAFIFYYKHCK